MNDSKKIEELLHYFRLEQKDFAEKCGFDNTSISNIKRDKYGISKKIADKILKAFPEVSETWLVTGKGSMLKNDTEQEKELLSVPLIPFSAIAGLGTDGLTEGVRFEDCEKYIVPEFIHGGVEFVIRVSGSSMYPKYSNGDILACRRVYDILFFQWGKTYVIDSISQGIMVKRIYKSDDDDYIKLVSDNKERYDAFDMPKSDIRSLSIVLGVIRME